MTFSPILTRLKAALAPRAPLTEAERDARQAAWLEKERDTESFWRAEQRERRRQSGRERPWPK